MGNSIEGQAPLPLTAQELEVLTDTTHYDSKELNYLRIQFYRDCGGSMLSSDNFIIAAEACGIRSEAVRYMLLNAFDADGDDHVSFFEFAQATSIMTRGTKEEKLDFAFRMYDVRRCNTIFYTDVLQILKGIERSFGGFILLDAPNPVSAAEVAERLFKGTMQLCKREFLNFVKMNPGVAKGLEF